MPLFLPGSFLEAVQNTVAGLFSCICGFRLQFLFFAFQTRLVHIKLMGSLRRVVMKVRVRVRVRVRFRVRFSNKVRVRVQD